MRPVVLRSLILLLCFAFGVSEDSLMAATLVWDANAETDLAGYKVYAREGTNSIPMMADVGLATQWVVSGVEQGKSILLNVTAYNEAGLESEWSETVAYAVPLNLTVTWPRSPVAGTASYRFSFGLLNQFAQSVNRGTNLSHSVPVTRGATYFFYAEALNGAGLVVDNYTQVVHAIPSSGALPDLALARQNIAPQVALTSPAAGAALTAGSSARLTASVSDADGTIARADFYAGTNKVGTASSAPFEVNWTPTTAGTAQLSVIAVDNSGASTRSAYVAVTVLAAVPLPVAPGGIAGTPTSSTAIRVSWVDKSTNEQGFSIYRSLSGGTLVKVASTGANIAVFNDTGLLPNSAYQYRISAFNAGGESAGTNCTVVTFPTAPNAPGSLSGLAMTNAVVLNWIDTSTNENSFKVYRALAGGTLTLIATLPAGTVAYTNSGLTALTTYDYRLAAANAGGETSSASLTITTLPNPPQAPSGLTAVAQWTPTIRLNWSDNATNEAGFYLYRSMNGGASTRIATLPANSLSFTNTGLITGTRYDYTITAFNAGGESTGAIAGTKTTGVAP